MRVKVVPTPEKVFDFPRSDPVSPESPDSAPDKSVSAPSVPVSKPKKVVSVFQFFPVSRMFAQKSNRVHPFACCFLKMNPSEEGIVPVRETTANIYTTERTRF